MRWMDQHATWYVAMLYAVKAKLRKPHKEGNWETKQVLSSSWDEQPFGRNTHGPKSRGLLCLIYEGDRRR